MTRDGDRELVGRARRRHSTNGLRRSNPARNLGIGHRRADRDFLKYLPHAFLEGSASNIQRKIEAEARRLDEADNLRHQGLVIAVSADKTRFGKAILKITHQVFRIVDGADDDWASWYAQWLIDLSELPDLLGARPVRSELIYLLVSLDKQYTAEGPSEPWETYYAHQILRHFRLSGS